MFSSPKTILSFVLLSSLLIVSCKSSTSNNKDTEAVAKVGSREIKLSQVDSVIKQQMGAGGGASFTPAELVTARLTVLDNLIQEEALFQKAQKDSLVPDDNKVNQEVQKRKQDANLTEDQYQAQIKQAGLTDEEIRDQIRRQLAINALRERENARVNQPTDAEIEKYYNDRKNEFRAERGADIAVIAVSPANNGGEAGAEQKIKAVHAQLKSGNSDFATVASQKSEEQSSAIRGGRLGFASEAGLKQSFPGIPDIATRIMSLTEGQYTDPMKDNSGNWYIFKLNGKREAPQNLTLNDVRADIINTMTQQRQQLLWNALMMVTLSEASVKNHLAERIVENPQTIVEMRPSQLLQQANSAAQPQQQQPQPRFENQNQSAPTASNGNRAASNANSNSRPSASSNANR
ncbi:MAG TPA: SurA N-terminal domain-containing protein [Blastocatellia bacterium]|nr:SurA N-terminal domain-containing protein [Blastocatellia bacterium]